MSTDRMPLEQTDGANTFICGSKVVMTDSTEDFVLSATLERIPPPVPFTHPKRLDGVTSCKKLQL